MARHLARASVLASSLFFVCAAAAQPFGKSGGEFRVNTYTTGYQALAQVGMDTAGGFLVVWQNGVFPTNVRAQRYAASGAALGGELAVTASSTTGSTALPAVVGQASGRYVVVWQNFVTGDSPNIRIFAQRIQDGALSGTAFRVDTGVTTARDQVPAVAPTASGDFAVIWGRNLDLSSGPWDLYGQRLATDGVALGGEFHVTTETTNAAAPAVARRSDGGFLVAWAIAPPQDGRVFAQTYSASGAAGALLAPNATGETARNPPAAAYDGAGNFVVVWAGFYVWGQRYDSAGNALGGNFRVDTSTTALPLGTQVAADSSGNFVVVWGTDTYAIYGRRFASSGAAIGDPFRVNTSTGTVLAARAAMSGAGDFVVVWQKGTYPAVDIFAQRYCATFAGDTNGSGTIDVGDVFYLINFLFAGGPAPLKGSDANGDGSVNVSDVFYLINYLFAGGPGPACG